MGSCQARLAGDTTGDRVVAASMAVEGLEELQMHAAPAQTLMIGLPQGSVRAWSHDTCGSQPMIRI